MIASSLAWASLFATYLVLAGRTSTDEMAAGAVCAAAAVLWWTAVRRASTHSFAIGHDGWAAAGRALRRWPPATLSVALVLLRALVGQEGGALVTPFFAHGRRSERADRGRRAVGVLAASFTPDSIVLRTPATRDEIVVHALPVGKPSTDPRWPV